MPYYSPSLHESRLSNTGQFLSVVLRTRIYHDLYLTINASACLYGLKCRTVAKFAVVDFSFINIKGPS